MRFPHTLTAILVATAALTAPASASALALQEVGTFDRPTYVTSDPADPDRLFVVERAGRIQLTEGGNTTTFLDIERRHDLSDGDYGLFSMAFSPDYATERLFYVAYTGVDDPSTPGKTSRATFTSTSSAPDGDTADPASRREVLTIEYRPTPETTTAASSTSDMMVTYTPRPATARHCCQAIPTATPRTPEPAREDPADRPGGVGPRRVHRSRRQPLHRRGRLRRRLRRDLELWAPKPVAVFV